MSPLDNLALRPYLPQNLIPTITIYNCIAKDKCRKYGKEIDVDERSNGDNLCDGCEMFG
jgi:hypothetical protein